MPPRTKEQKEAKERSGVFIQRGSKVFTPEEAGRNDPRGQFYTTPEVESKYPAFTQWVRKASGIRDWQNENERQDWIIEQERSGYGSVAPLAAAVIGSGITAHELNYGMHHPLDDDTRATSSKYAPFAKRLQHERLNNAHQRRLLMAEKGSQLDPAVRKAYLKSGSGGNVNSAQRNTPGFKRVTTPEVSSPSDLSKAGKWRINPPSKNNVTLYTVTPGPDSDRFTTYGPHFSEFERDKQGQVWAGRTPQDSYADGNTSAKQNVPQNRALNANKSNPAIHVLDADLDPAKRTGHMTTSQVQANARHANGLKLQPGAWAAVGDNVLGSDNVHVDKNSITSRGIVTFNDLYTKVKQLDPNFRVGDNTAPGAKLFAARTRLQELTRGNGDRVLQELASPPGSRNQGDFSLGTTNLDELTNSERRRAGLGTLFDSDGRSIISTDDYRRTNQAVTRRFARSGGLGLGLGLAAASRPVVEQLEEGNLGNAAAITTSSMATGAVLDRGSAILANRSGLLGNAAHGLRGFAGVAGPVLMAYDIGGSTPQPDVKSWNESDPRKVQVNQQTPSKIGKLGPDNPFGDTSIAEQKRISQLPKKTRQVKSLPITTQAGYNLKNEVNYMKNTIRQGKLPYLPF